MVWEYADADAEYGDGVCAEDVELPPLPPPAGCCDLKLAQLTEMLALGAVVAIKQWADEMAEVHSEYSRVWAEIRRPATSVDLIGLRELVVRLQPPAWSGKRA